MEQREKINDGKLDELDSILESVLFALGRDISYKELSDTLQEDLLRIQDSIKRLETKYSKACGINLVHVKDGVQLVTNKLNYEYVNKFVENTKKQILSTAVLETLSIIAYNPKITKAEIEKIRGVNSDFAVGRLLECGLVEEIARLNLPGRPAIYSVTNEFLKSCGITDITELPDFESIRIEDEQMIASDYVNENRDSEDIQYKEEDNNK